MNTLRNSLKANFSQIPNDLVTDTTISAGELRVLLYLFTKPDNWKVYNADVCKNLNISEKTLTKYWKSLTKSRWLRRERAKDENGLLTGGFNYYIGDFGRSGDDDDSNRNNDRNGTFSVSEKSSGTEKSYDHINNKPIKKQVTNNKNKKEKETISKNAKTFDFSLSRATSYDNLSKEYKEKLHAKCLLADGNVDRYDDFINQLEAKGYKYKNFYKAYLAWDKEKRYKAFNPPVPKTLGEPWREVYRGYEKLIAVNKETLEIRYGKIVRETPKKEPTKGNTYHRDVSALINPIANDFRV